MFEAAQLVGLAVRTVYESDARLMKDSEINFDVSFLFGGQIEGRHAAPLHDLCRRQFHRMHDRHAVSCRSASTNTASRSSTARSPTRRDLYDALKIGADLDGFDHALEPCRRYADRHCGDPARRARAIELNYRIMPGEPYFTDLRERWSAALREAHIAIPSPPYATSPIETASIPEPIDAAPPRTGAHANAANMQLTAGQPAAKVLQQQNLKP
jgi:putative proteasome-type protease